MADTILVVVEQRQGKLNPVSYETLVGAQAIAAETGWTLEAAVVGTGVSAIANDVATKKVSKVYAIESDKLTPYTPDGFVAALKTFIEQKQPRLVLMPHTYQVRDFAPKLATSLHRTLISDTIGYRKDGDRVLFTRQMFQGKFAADVAFTGPRRTSRPFRPAPSVPTSLSPAPLLPSRTSPPTSPPPTFATNRKRSSRKPSRPSTSPRLTSSSPSVAASRNRRTSISPSSSPTLSAAKSQPHARSATRDGSPWIARSAAPARPSRLSSTSPSASAAPFSTSLV